MIKGAKVTTDRAPIPAVVVTHQATMKEARWLATSLADRTVAEVVTLYGKRLTPRTGVANAAIDSPAPQRS